MSEMRDALIVGCGKIAGGYNRAFDDEAVLTHALAYHRHPAYRLVACVDPNEAAREKFMAQWQVPEGYVSLDEALAARKFDIVSVCSPTGTHVVALQRLLDAPVKAIFAEKPIDGDATAARELAARFEAKGIPVAVNFLRRFDRSMHELKASIATGGYGPLRSVSGSYNRGVVNNGSHLLDLIHFLTAGRLNVSSVSPAEEFELQGDPNVHAMLALGDIPVRISGAASAGFELELVFERTTVKIEDSGFAARVGGEQKPTRLGVAFLSALDELASWRPGATLSSGLATAAEAIELTAKIRRMAMEKTA